MGPIGQASSRGTELHCPFKIYKALPITTLTLPHGLSYATMGTYSGKANSDLFMQLYGFYPVLQTSTNHYDPWKVSLPDYIYVKARHLTVPGSSAKLVLSQSPVSYPKLYCWAITPKHTILHLIELDTVYTAKQYCYLRVLRLTLTLPILILIHTT